MSAVRSRSPLASGLRALRLRATVSGLPVLLVSVGLVLVLGARITQVHGDIASLACFGSQFARFTHPPTGSAGCGTQGYDGQFFFLQAHDPLLLNASTVQAMRGAGQLFRVQRLGYPLAVFLLAGGQATAIPVAMLAVNLLALLGLTAWLAAWSDRHGRSPLWAVAIGLMPGMLLPVLRDLSDPLATASVVIGVLAWQERRRTTAAVALTVAVLTREVTIVLVAALAVEVGMRLWQMRMSSSARGAIVREAVPVIVVPALMFGAWQLYVASRAGGALGTAPAAIPFANLVQEVGWSLRDWPIGVGVWDLFYVALVCTTIVLSLRALWGGSTVIGIGALACSAFIVLPRLGDFWGDTRLSAPLLALVLLDGLRRRDRLSVAVPTIAAVMTLFILPAI
jgi:hypothetical protein